MPRGVYNRTSKSDLQRFEEEYITEPNSGCWIWIGSRRSNGGYGQFWIRGPDNKRVLAHRWSYEHFREIIPKKLTIDHLCRVRCCVNPDHLEPVANKENILRGVGACAGHARQTHCYKGHSFDEKNTIRCNQGVSRRCKICRDLYMYEYRRKFKNQ